MTPSASPGLSAPAMSRQRPLNQPPTVKLNINVGPLLPSLSPASKHKSEVPLNMNETYNLNPQKK